MYTDTIHRTKQSWSTIRQFKQFVRVSLKSCCFFNGKNEKTNKWGGKIGEPALDSGLLFHTLHRKQDLTGRTGAVQDIFHHIYLQLVPLTCSWVIRKLPSWRSHGCGNIHRGKYPLSFEVLYFRYIFWSCAWLYNSCASIFGGITFHSIYGSYNKTKWIDTLITRRIDGFEQNSTHSFAI